MSVHKKQVITHNGTFHADEVVAVALLQIYAIVDPANFEIIRTRDIEVINQGDIVLDVGGILDLDRKRFDHHQIKEGKISTAGIVWHWIKQLTNEENVEIDRFINAIDKHDCGIEKMPDFSFAHIIAEYNDLNVLDDDKQQIAFNAAVNIAATFITSLKAKPSQLQEAAKIIASSQVISIGKNKILQLSEYAPNWMALIHGSGQYSDITHVIWFVKQKNQWCIQIPAINVNSFVLAHPKLAADENALFIHQNGFLGVYESKDAILNMLNQ